MTTVAQPPTKGYRTIRLPLAEHEYERFLSDRTYAKARLHELYEDYPELFPEAFPWGYVLYVSFDSIKFVFATQYFSLVCRPAACEAAEQPEVIHCSDT